jgi:hypothetical protein
MEERADKGKTQQISVTIAVRAATGSSNPLYAVSTYGEELVAV